MAKQCLEFELRVARDVCHIAQFRLALRIIFDEFVVSARQYTMSGREYEIARDCGPRAGISARADDHYGCLRSRASYRRATDHRSDRQYVGEREYERGEYAGHHVCYAAPDMRCEPTSWRVAMQSVR